MPTKPAKQAARPLRESDSVTFNLTVNNTPIYKGMLKVQTEMGLPSIQDVARIAIAKFLKGEGIIK